MGRVQLFEVSLSHGRVVYSPGEPLAGAVRVRLGAPLPFRGGRGVPSGEGRAGGAQVAAQHLRQGRGSRKRRRVAPGPGPAEPVAPPAAPAFTLPRAPGTLGGLGCGRPGGAHPPGWVAGARWGRSREVRVAQSFRICPSRSSLLGSARVGGGGLDPAHLAEGRSDLDTGTTPTLPGGSAGPSEPRTCWALTWSPAHAGLSLPRARPLAQPTPSPHPGATPAPTQAEARPCELGGSCSSLWDLGLRPSERAGADPEPRWPVPLLVQTSGTLGLGVSLPPRPSLGLSAGAGLICYQRCGQGPGRDFSRQHLGCREQSCGPGPRSLITGSECEAVCEGVPARVLLHLGVLGQSHSHQASLWTLILWALLW